MASARWLALWACVLAGCGEGELSKLGADASVSTDDAREPDPSDSGADASSPAPAADAGQDAGDPGSADAHDASATVGKGGPNGGHPSWLIAPGDSVFFVGNSFFGAGERLLPDWVAAVGRASTPVFPIQTGALLQAGVQRLSWFFQQPESQQAVASKQYDVFVLQGYELEPVEEPDTFKAAVRDYHAAITANGGRVMLFMTWDFPGTADIDPDFYAKLVRCYDEIGRELHIPVIPAGQIYHDVNGALPAGQEPWFLLNEDDRFHQSAAGSAVNAYATFMMLTGINPLGAAITAPNNTNSPELLKYLSDKSWAEVAPRLAE